jgi:hypothetical protein
MDVEATDVKSGCPNRALGARVKSRSKTVPNSALAITAGWLIICLGVRKRIAGDAAAGVGSALGGRVTSVPGHAIGR